MSTWYYMKDGTRMGPVPTEELTSLLSTGKLRGDALVWREGLASWVAASTLPEFAGAVPATPPPAAVASAPTPPPAPGAASTTGGPGVEIPDPADVEKNKIFGVLCYLPPLLFIVSLLAARQSKFAMYHCNQGVVLTLTWFACWVALFIVGIVLALIPVIGWIMIMLLNFCMWIGVLVLAVMGIINAAQGVCKPLPLIGNRFTLVK